jgi:DNA-binding SARP family transcriptional activator
MLKLKTLGGLTLTAGTSGSTLTQRQRLALLAILAVAGEKGITRDRVLALLWPDSPEESARHSLGQLLYALRRDLGSPDGVLGTTTLTLNPEIVGTDLREYAEATEAGDHDRAVALYAGPFLDGVHLGGSVDLEQWATNERRRLAEIHQRTLEAAAIEAERRGDGMAAVRWWRSVAALDPLSSRVTLALMRALAAVGDRAAAMQAARIHETLVRSELESEPDPAIADYAEELRSPVREKRPAAVATVSTAVGPIARRGSSRAKLAWAAGALVAATGVALALQGWTRETATPLDPKRVHIARFENRTGRSDLDHVGAMAADWVTQGLERSGLIQVAISSSRAENAGVPTSDEASDDAVAERAAQLSAGTLVSGAYYLRGDSIVFQTRISDVARGEVMAALDPVAGPISDPTRPIEALRQRTIGALASLFDPRLASWVRIASKPPTYEAYREFVMGETIWARDYRQALAHMQRAAAFDSTFYAAQVEIAIIYRVLDECNKSEAIAAKLLAIQEKLAPFELHVLKTQVATCRGQWEAALAEQRALVELRPGSPLLDYGYALALRSVGRYRESAEVLARHDIETGIAQVGPNYPSALGFALIVLGERDRGLEVVRRARRIVPDWSQLWGVEGFAMATEGRVADAMRIVDSLIALPLRPTAVVALPLHRIAAILALQGHAQESKQTLERTLTWLAGRPASERSTESIRLQTGQTLYQLERWDEARALFEQMAADSVLARRVHGHGYLGLIAARRGDVARAEAADAFLASGPAVAPFRNAFYRARIAAVLGRRDVALSRLEAAIGEMGQFWLADIETEPDLVALRNEPRFKELMRLR